MLSLKLKTDGTAIRTLKQIMLSISILLAVFPFLTTLWSNLTVAPEVSQILYNMFATGIYLLAAIAVITVLLSRYSPVKWLAVRKKLILFTRMFIKPEDDGTIIHSVRWKYAVKGKVTTIHLYPNGLVNDTAAIGEKLSEFLGEPLLKYEASDGKACYIFGKSPERYDGIELLGEGVTTLTGEYKPNLSYEPIPIYDNVKWDFNSEALHVLLLAPTGSGKTMLLNYLAGMVLKRQHRLYVVDAKNTPFGRFFRHIGVQVATKTDEIIRLLNALVQEMEERYAKYFASNEVDIDANFATLNLEGHFLIFDELLAALNAADKKERAEMERLLGQLALKGRAAGFSLVITAQKLNATDLPKSITEQCQTRIIMGSLVSDETFHQATGLYKKDLAHPYRGNVGKGYAVTPKSDGLSYIETPLMPSKSDNYKALLKELRDRGIPYGEGR